MRRILIYLTIGILFSLSISISSSVLAQAIKPLSGTKGASAINNGVDHFTRGDFNTALNHFQEALKANPRSAVAHYNLALTFNRMGQSDKASKHFKEAENLGRLNPFIQNSRILKQNTQSQEKRR